MGIKAVFYDCVGPLLVKKTGIKLTSPYSEIDQMCGSAVNEKFFWDEIKCKFVLNDDEITKFVELISKSYTQNKPMWNFQTKIRPKLKTAVINNGTYAVFDSWISRYKMAENFDGLFNSSRLGMKKPDPKIFNFCCSEMNVRLEEAILIDDSQDNIDGAIKAGLGGIFYDPQKHTQFLHEINSLLI